jgi:predicted transcriptional regulator
VRHICYHYSIVENKNQGGGQMVYKNNLKAVLESKGISQLDLYKLTGISPASLSNIVTGRLIPYDGWGRAYF